MTNEERMRVEEIRSMEATTPDGHMKDNYQEATP